MQRPSPIRTVLPADWLNVLERGRQALQQAEAEAARRLAAIEASPDLPATDQEVGWRGVLGQMQERLEGLTANANRPAPEITEADAALDAEEKTLRRWLRASEAARRKLAEWAARG